MNENRKNKLDSQLDRIKTQFFYSKQNYLKNFLKYESIELPRGIEADSLLHWNQEKKVFLAAQKEELSGLKESYISSLLSQLDAVEAIQSKLETKIVEVEDTKEMSVIIKSLEGILKMRNEIIDKLQIDATVDTEHQDNKNATDELLNSNIGN